MDNTKVLAVVGGKQITETDVEMLIASMGQAGQNYRSPQGKAAVLEELINQKLMLLDAVRNLYEREPEFKEQLARVNLIVFLYVKYSLTAIVSIFIILSATFPFATHLNPRASKVGTTSK